MVIKWKENINKTKSVLITNIANNREVESERSDFLILSRRHYLEYPPLRLVHSPSSFLTDAQSVH